MAHLLAWSILVGAIAAKAMLDRTIIEDEIIIRMGGLNASAMAKRISPRIRAVAGYHSLRATFLPFSLRIIHTARIGGAR